MELAPKIVLFAIGAGLAFYATSFLPEKAEDRVNRLRNEAETNAHRECVGEILDKLKAPSTAKFSPYFAPTVNGDTIEFAGWVDAQNSYGAMLRQKWLCEARISTEGKSVDVTLF